MDRIDNDTLIKYYLQKQTSERLVYPLYYLKSGVTSGSYLTINKETLYMMASEKELDDDESKYINKFTLNELDLILSLDNDLIKNRKLFILERV